MATGLNKYAGVYNNEIHGGILRCEAGFTFIDLLPKTVVPRGFLQPPVYESFRGLVDRANEFLRNNREWKITTCESVEFRLKNYEVNPLKMTYVEYGESYTTYIRGLRLWLTERKNKRKREQRIGYFNLISQKLEKGGKFKPCEFETLDMVIERFNSQLQSNPLPGRIITIESQKMKTSIFKKLDPDKSTWHERGSATKTYLFVIRIFYEVMDGSFEEIGIQDFIPDKIKEGGIFTWPEFRQFSTVVKKASDWCAQQQDFRFCNVQSLEIKVKGDKVINSQRMDFTKSGTSTNYYVRVLRIAYTKPLSNRCSISDNPSPIRDLTCRTFEPVKLSNFPEYENLGVTRERISAWVKATGAHVLSAETTTYRIKSSGERKQGSEATFCYSSSEKDYDWMFVIRLYLEGFYKEPSPEMLPALPEFKELCCNIL